MNPANGPGGAYGAAPAKQRTEAGSTERRNIFSETPLASRNTGYGLPCAHCKTYYSADHPSCPVCKSPQRVGPTAPLTHAAPAERLPDPEQLEQERERFLNEFKSQVVASPLPPDLPAPEQHCNRVENHGGGPEPAAICQGCYDRLQERVDVLEAAMHIDVIEAAQIVYDAVWADPSDPNKTYQNAAQALLTELRRRSGIPQVFGPLQPPVN
ncbi:MAG TPA: hypothetical protein VF133_10465 [Terriglobales bacterium]